MDNATVKENTESSVEPAPSAASEPAEPAFSIDYWISYAQEYAKSVGLNLDSTAVTAGTTPSPQAHTAFIWNGIFKAV